MNKGLKREIIINSALIVVLSVIAFLVANIGQELESGVLVISYSADKSIALNKSLAVKSLFSGIILPAVYVSCLFFVRGSESTPTSDKRGIAAFSIFSFLGFAAYTIMVCVADGFGITYKLAAPIAMAITLIYFLLIYKLYFEDKSSSNLLFWEIFRFALVGLTAAVVDFAIAFSVQFYAFKGHIGWFITTISTACGFVGGVIINYVLSTYMVYKNAKTNFSKSVVGVSVFVGLSIVGLMIGIGLQYFLYDYLYLDLGAKFFSYPIDFVIRTLIVMVYNYVSRKLIIYK